MKYRIIILRRISTLRQSFKRLIKRKKPNNKYIVFNKLLRYQEGFKHYQMINDEYGSLLRSYNKSKNRKELIKNEILPFFKELINTTKYHKYYPPNYILDVLIVENFFKFLLKDYEQR